MKEPYILTRRELYDLVWDRPMTKVAAEFQISDVALKKICVKHRVPAPGRGYWAKVTAGSKIHKTIFREISDSRLNQVRIYGSPAKSLPPQVHEAKRQAKIQTRNIELPPAQEVSSPGEFTLHVQRMEKALSRARAGHDGFLHVAKPGLFTVSISEASVNRTLSILNRLTIEGEALGYGIEKGENSLHFIVNDEKISLALSEKTDRVPHEPTEKELSNLNKWEAKRQRYAARGEWFSDWDKPAIPELDHAPNGKLVIEIDKDNQWDGLRRKFSDGKRQRLENLIGEILVAAATCAAAMKAKREERERQHLKWEEESRRRKEVERQRLLGQKRWEFLEKQIEQFEHVQRVEKFIGFLEAEADTQIRGSFSTCITPVKGTF